jgi:hypothetical protein
MCGTVGCGTPVGWHDSVERRRIDHVPEQLHRMRVCLHLVMHFTNSLHSYLMNKASFSDWGGLEAAMRRAETLQHLVATHDSFVEELRKSMLLSDVSPMFVSTWTHALACTDTQTHTRARSWLSPCRSVSVDVACACCEQTVKMARREVEALLDSALEFTSLYRAYQAQTTKTIRAHVEVRDRSCVCTTVISVSHDAVSVSVLAPHLSNVHAHMPATADVPSSTAFLH